MSRTSTVRIELELKGKNIQGRKTLIEAIEEKLVTF
jgi:hypothetical protein